MVSRRQILKANGQAQQAADEADERRQRTPKTRPKEAESRHFEAASKTTSSDMAESQFHPPPRRPEQRPEPDRRAPRRAEEHKPDQFHESLLDDALSLDWAQRQRRQAARQNKWPKREQQGAGKQQAKVARNSRRAEPVAGDELADGDEPGHGAEQPKLWRNFDPYSIYGDEDDEEDVWYSEERLKQDHIEEIVNKWHSIDDEIWAKIICMEQNRRVAKAYARKHTVSINGSRDEYLDGTTLGLNSFENPDRDSKTSYIKQFIGEGVKLKIHQNGDIFAKRLSRSNVFVHQFRAAPRRPQPLKGSQSSSDVYALNSSECGGDFYGIVRPKQDQAKRRPSVFQDKTSGPSSGASSQNAPAAKAAGAGQLVQADKVVRLFSMSKFKQVLELESRKNSPNRARLLNMCISVVSFVVDDQKMLNLPSWIMVINIVAMDLLSSEIGLFEPYDDLPALARHSVGDHWAGLAATRRNTNNSFECFSEDHDYENDGEELVCCEERAFRELEPPFSGLERRPATNYCPRHRPNLSDVADHQPACNGELSAYDSNRSEDYNNSTESNHKPAGESRSLADRTRGHFGQLRRKAGGPQKEANSDGELANGSAKPCDQEGPRNAVERLGSSSSGFVSSHQNDSSANSSSLNIANSDRQNLGAPKMEPVLSSKVKLRQKLLGARDREEAPDNQQVNQTRSKRAPKMPHGLADSAELADLDSLSSENEPPVIMSDPIPIPAPPTSAGGPTGKANLILVSPTGLNLSTTKKLHYGDTQAEDHESNQCLTAKETKRSPRLPVGIPAHAQLAPPATRKHILRYLMSMGRTPGPRSRLQQAALPRPPPAPPTFVSGKRLQRPLPGLPGGLCHKQQADESLYYRGLQVRAMQARTQAARDQAPPYACSGRWLYGPPLPPPPPPHMAKPGGPIDVGNILSNFKNSTLFRRQLAKHSHKQSLTSCPQAQKHGQRTKLKSGTNIATSGHPDLCELKKPYMRSLDSIHVKTAPGSTFQVTSLSTLLSSVGNLLKGTKTIKSSAPNQIGVRQ